MTHLHRNIRFTLELSFEARTDSVAIGPDLDAMLAHVAARRLLQMTPEDLVQQVRIVADRAAPIAPFVRRRPRQFVLQREQHSKSSIPGKPQTTPTRSSETHNKSSQGGTDSRRSIRQSPTTPRRWSA